ncbi:nuclear mRNA export, poly(A)+RNA binding protein [Friedmanniomyces endolithicus]|uniref:mRNA export factor MEX67 n=1 Tax=Friedmanniomyces endolithicus TaxID=329885 RepID=A0AAN6KA84_9PEZI|nr:nuclear mRNA export, poly(A)+RNA binding protein [Friedmanniomyces endolithicus]KAK0781105.1 nuclear mRNA export, poly(A)+RNA binding protein [Friedmanniomyces endolithicus]KAK0792601.1 nuclear mRNA export, poly(A)+RNA binding protein [Friedmanniomyces endolithicus]KAK0805919.1 nuclear mRNA export, poly(A)+RNA binding protein [Friedmanniomyces endolithicus]KAK0854344.1 nuclear mRNA export, poly(A)+RNA binding protein [Friedmanniomyces endolithicus]
MVARHTAPRAAPRGPAATRRAAIKADRDGDLTMGLPVKGRAGVGKGTGPPTGPRIDGANKPGRGGILDTLVQRAILRQASGTRDVAMREERAGSARGGLVELRVTGWNKSKASGDADGGVSSLIRWLEKKASSRLGSRVRNVKIKKSQVEGTDLIVKVAPDDAVGLLRMNGFGWAGVNVTVERLGGPVESFSVVSSDAEKTKAMLRGVLERRYDHEAKFLNLSELAQDEELKSQHIFDLKSTASKFFPAMMRVLELSFDKPEERDAAVTSVSLANNDLVDLAAVTTLSQTLPKLQNLDLSNNKFEKLEHLHNWRRRFVNLQHLILTGNPLEQNDSNYHKDVIGWYPNLRQLNGIQVRTDEEIAKKARTTDLPFPIRSPLFKDEGGIAEQFVRIYFAGFDNDRVALASHYYDEQSEFSYAVNTQAPRDPNSTQRSEPGEWESYLKSSRNLKKIQQLPARQARKYRGTQAVADAIAMLPLTRHPDLASEARKWMVEAKMVPGVPDPTGASPGGVDGFLITVHGEFEELNLSGQPSKKRSFDRSFVLGPGGVAGVRIVSDMLTLRSYGGTQAFEPENFDAWTEPSTILPVAEPAVPGLPAGLSIAEAEQTVAQLMQQTGMTLSYAKDCLDQVGWNYLGAVEAFGKVRGSLPAEAFVLPTA